MIQNPTLNFSISKSILVYLGAKKTVNQVMGEAKERQPEKRRDSFPLVKTMRKAPEMNLVEVSFHRTIK